MKARIWNFNGWTGDTDPEKLKTYYDGKLRESGFKILDIAEHFFTPFGYTCLFLLGESHFAIHTFPEEEKSYIEISSCNEKYFNRFVEMIKNDDKIL